MAARGQPAYRPTHSPHPNIPTSRLEAYEHLRPNTEQIQRERARRESANTARRRSLHNRAVCSRSSPSLGVVVDVRLRDTVEQHGGKGERDHREAALSTQPCCVVPDQAPYLRRRPSLRSKSANARGRRFRRPVRVVVCATVLWRSAAVRRAAAASARAAGGTAQCSSPSSSWVSA